MNDYVEQPHCRHVFLSLESVHYNIPNASVLFRVSCDAMSNCGDNRAITLNKVAS